LELALTLFSKEGYQQTSLQDIATELGITRPLFYYYFGSKEELLHSLIGHLGDAMLEQTRPILRSDSAALVRLRRAFRIHAELLFDNTDAFRVYFAERDRMRNEGAPYMSGEAEYMSLITDAVASGQADQSIRPGPPRVLALLATGLLNSTLRWYSAEGALTREELATIASNMALRSLSGDHQADAS
jgi:AcrR family transcriptional regulator